MALEINELRRRANGARYTSPSRICLTADEPPRLVDETDPDAVKLLVGEGCQIPIDEARKYGLVIDGSEPAGSDSSDAAAAPDASDAAEAPHKPAGGEPTTVSEFPQPAVNTDTGKRRSGVWLLSDGSEFKGKKDEAIAAEAALPSADPDDDDGEADDDGEGDGPSGDGDASEPGDGGD